MFSLASAFQTIAMDNDMMNFILVSLLLALGGLVLVFFSVCIIFMMMETKWYRWFDPHTIKKYVREVSREFDFRLAALIFIILFFVCQFVVIVSNQEAEDRAKKTSNHAADIECSCNCSSCYEVRAALGILKSENLELLQISDDKTNSLGTIIFRVSKRNP